jgi:hypothetical protein
VISINFHFSSFVSIKEREAQPHSNLITLVFHLRFYAANKNGTSVTCKEKPGSILLFVTQCCFLHHQDMNPKNEKKKRDKEKETKFYELL